MSRKLLGDFAVLLKDLQSPIKWYNKNKEKEMDKDMKERKEQKF